MDSLFRSCRAKVFINPEMLFIVIGQTTFRQRKTTDARRYYSLRPTESRNTLKDSKKLINFARRIDSAP